MQKFTPVSIASSWGARVVLALLLPLNLPFHSHLRDGLSWPHTGPASSGLAICPPAATPAPTTGCRLPQAVDSRAGFTWCLRLPHHMHPNHPDLHCLLSCLLRPSPSLASQCLSHSKPDPSAGMDSSPSSPSQCHEPASIYLLPWLHQDPELRAALVSYAVPGPGKPQGIQGHQGEREKRARGGARHRGVRELALHTCIQPGGPAT